MKTLTTALALALISTAAFGAEKTSVLDDKVMAALKQCQTLSQSCNDTTAGAAGILVFPSVVKADLLIGAAGGEGALIENGKITSHYSIGAATAGIQAGISDTSQVYVFQTKEALNKLKTGDGWKVGGTADVTVMTTDAGARGVNDKGVLAYVFDSSGLHAGIALDVLNVWKTGTARPQG